MNNNKMALSALAGILMATLSGCDDDNDKYVLTGIDANISARAVLSAQSPEGAAEIVQYQKSTGYIFAINSSGDQATIEILDPAQASPAVLAKNSEGVVTTTNMTIQTTVDLSLNTTGDANSIAISDELEMLAVAMAADATGDNGYIAFYDISGPTPTFIKNVEVGVLPDMVTFSPDSKKVVVANEGEPSGDYNIDPEGSISIINVTNNMPESTAVSLNFQGYNAQKTTLAAQGVMFPSPSGKTINGSLITTTVAMDLEPEYVAINDNSTYAYVSMQENNAMAVVNLTDNTLVDVYGLGFKDWSKYKLDASDKDDGINMRSYDNLYGMFQPDTIASLTFKGEDYIVTANEGDGREYFFDVADEDACDAANGLDYDDGDGCLSYTDESRVEDLDLDAVAFAGINNDDDDLGRLKVSIERGDIDNDGEYEELYTYGARSFSIFDVQGNLVFDSGDDIERITAEIHQDAFNNDEDTNEGDTRSDAKGPEPEALAIGNVDGHTLAFIGLERMGGIMVYDISNPMAPVYVDYFFNRGLVEDADITGDLAPEGMKFIAKTAEHPARLIVGNEISGSVTVWDITPVFEKQ